MNTSGRSWNMWEDLDRMIKIIPLNTPIAPFRGPNKLGQ